MIKQAPPPRTKDAYLDATTTEDLKKGNDNFASLLHIDSRNTLDGSDQFKSIFWYAVLSAKHFLLLWRRLKVSFNY